MIRRTRRLSHSPRIRVYKTNTFVYFHVMLNKQPLPLSLLSERLKKQNKNWSKICYDTFPLCLLDMYFMGHGEPSE